MRKTPVFSALEDVILLRVILNLRAHLRSSNESSINSKSSMLSQEILKDVWRSFQEKSQQEVSPATKRSPASLRVRFLRLLDYYASNTLPSDTDVQTTSERETLLKRIIQDRASAYAAKNIEESHICLVGEPYKEGSKANAETQPSKDLSEEQSITDIRTRLAEQRHYVLGKLHTALQDDEQVNSRVFRFIKHIKKCHEEELQSLEQYLKSRKAAKQAKSEECKLMIAKVDTDYHAAMLELETQHRQRHKELTRAAKVLSDVVGQKAQDSNHP